MNSDNFLPSSLPVTPNAIDSLVLLHRARLSLLWARWCKQQAEKYYDACTHVSGLHPDLDQDMSSIANTYRMCAVGYRYQAKQALVLAEKRYGKAFICGRTDLPAARELRGYDFTFWPDYKSIFPRDTDDIWTVYYA